MCENIEKEAKTLQGVCQIIVSDGIFQILFPV